MNFFQNQHNARRKTWQLVVFFLLAVVLIVLALNVVIFAVFFMSSMKHPSLQVHGLNQWFTTPYAFWASVGILAVIVMGNLNTFYKLRGGGRSVAELVGATRVDPNTSDLKERRLINVVEEMSIASGTPVPELYVLEDNAINAFVAGYRPTETVLVVTRGGLDAFTRDELQGVIGHEYSHIFNGDMRINIRLMGILAGILLIGQIGGFIMRTGGRAASSRSSSNRGGGAQIIILGLALFIIGYIGLFFGSLIKAAISRQREYLADASSVQFTRNPDGIAGALWTIKERIQGSQLLNAHADDISHFCFSNAVGEKVFSMMATHPPLEARINAISPHYNLKMRLKHRQESEAAEAAAQQADAGTAAGLGGIAAVGFAGAAATAVNGAKVRDSIGQVKAEHLDYASKVYAAIPKQLGEAAHKRDTVRQLIYALTVADTKDGDRQSGLQVIERAEGADSVVAVNRFIDQVQEAGNRYRLALINISIPTLKSLPWEQRAEFLTTLEDLVKVDHRYTIFEFAMLTILREHLAEDAGQDIKEKYFKYGDVLDEIKVLLSLLAWTGAANAEEARTAYNTIMKQFTPDPVAMVDKAECKLSAVTAALKKLNQLSHILKQTVIESFADCVIQDGKVLPAEAELLQAIATSLDSPMPPLQA